MFSSPEHAAKVLSATPDELQLATTDDDIQENKADVTLRMGTPLPAAQVPQPGTMLTGKWVGKATSYTPLPPAANQNATGPAAGASGPAQNQPAGCLPNTGGGVMLTLTEGAKQGSTTKKPTAPAKRRTAAKKKPAARR